MFLNVKCKPFRATFLPNLFSDKTFFKLVCLEQSVPMSLEIIVLGLVLPTTLSKGPRIVLELDIICSMISFEGFPEVIYQRKVLKTKMSMYVNSI